MSEEKEVTRTLNVTLTYPHSDEYEFITKIEIIDLDKEAQQDIASGNGFIISAPKNTNKKDMKNIDGIYSSRFGQKLGDVNPFADRYSCDCGYLKSRINHDMECPMCHTKVKYVDDNFKMFGWIILKDEYHILHPKFFDALDYIMGESKYNHDRKKVNKGCRKLDNILYYNPEVDQNGFAHPCEFKPDKEPYYGIGMTEFYNRFDEILEYYHDMYPKKQEYFDEIYKYRNLVFCHSIPVFTTHLRPADIKDGYMYFEPTNGMYNMINKHVHMVNNDKRRMNKGSTIKDAELYNIQSKYQELCNEVFEILNGKKGVLRGLVGGRYNFSSRCVIRQDSSLRVDQVKLPYVELVKALQQPIINVLVRNFNISPSEAYDKWYRAIAKKDDRIAEILDNLIHANPEGLPVLINRNPTINYGSIMQCFVVGYTDTLTMSVPLQALKPLAADFDGDVLNIMHIINEAFFERCYQIFNPRNAMYISRIDGKLNSDLLVQRDTVINANTFLHLGRDNYSEKQLNAIKEAKERQKAYYSDDSEAEVS